MAQVDLISLTAKLGLESASFQKGMDKANRSLDRLSRNSSKTGAAMKAMGKGLVAMAAAAASALSVDMLKGVLDWADSLAKVADKLDTGTYALQRYRRIAELSGVAQGTMESSLATLSKRLGEAKIGTGALHSKLSRFNKPLLEALKNSNGINEAMLLLADAMAAADTQTEKNTLAVAAFSKAGLGMVAIMKNGGLAMLQTTKDMAILGDESFRTAEQINDDWTRLWGDTKTNAKGFAIEVVSDVKNMFRSVSDIGLGELIELRDKVQTEYAKYERGVWETGNAKLATGEAAIKLAKYLDEIEAEILVKKSIQYRYERHIAALKRQSTSTFKSGDENDTKPGIPAPIDLSELDRVIAKQAEMEEDFDTRVQAMRAISESMNPLEPLKLQIEFIQGLIEEFPSFAEDGAKAIVAIQEEMTNLMAEGADKIEDASNNIESWSDTIGNNIERWANQAGDAFLDFTQGAKEAFTDLANSILNELARIAIQKAIIGPLVSAFGFSDGAAFAGPVQAFAGGGVVSSPTIFPFAGGVGLMAEAGPEAIMPLTRRNGKLGVEGGGSGDVNVIVNNNAPVQVKTESKRNSNGGVDIALYIEKTVGEYFDSGGGDAMMARTYGGRRMPR